MAKIERDEWFSRLARPSEVETPIYFQIYLEYVRNLKGKD